MVTQKCQMSYENMKRQVANIVEIRHYDIFKDIRKMCAIFLGHWPLGMTADIICFEIFKHSVEQTFD